MSSFTTQKTPKLFWCYARSNCTRLRTFEETVGKLRPHHTGIGCFKPLELCFGLGTLGSRKLCCNIVAVPHFRYCKIHPLLMTWDQHMHWWESSAKLTQSSQSTMTSHLDREEDFDRKIHLNTDAEELIANNFKATHTCAKPTLVSLHGIVEIASSFDLERGWLGYFASRQK